VPRSRYFSRKVVVGRSGAKGRGMFAAGAIARGEVIEVAPVLIVPTDEADDLLTTFLGHYIFRTDRGDRYVIGLGTVSLFNHGRRPNAEFHVTLHQIKIQARQRIEAGDEVTVSYGWTAREWNMIGGRLD
jgi:SET domain-containing protein